MSLVRLAETRFGYSLTDIPDHIRVMSSDDTRKKLGTELKRIARDALPTGTRDDFKFSVRLSIRSLRPATDQKAISGNCLFDGLAFRRFV